MIFSDGVGDRLDPGHGGRAATNAHVGALFVERPWHRPLHNGTARRLRRVLRRRPGVGITTVAPHLVS